MCDSPGLVDFAIGLVIFVFNLPNGQVLFFREIHITEGLYSCNPANQKGKNRGREKSADFAEFSPENPAKFCFFFREISEALN